MTTRKRFKIAVFLIAALFIGLIFADSLGVFSQKGYSVVPHGSHNHYVPHDRDPAVSLDAFPTRPPAEGERITPYGEIVRDTP